MQGMWRELQVTPHGTDIKGGDAGGAGRGQLVSGLRGPS